MSSAFPLVARGGAYYRVCGPDWEDPSDTTYSKRLGGRWNPPDNFGVLYLNQNLEGARANARCFITRQFGPDVLPEDIEAAYLPDVATFAIEPRDFVDAVTEGSNVGYADCRRVGLAAYAAGEDGIATTSEVAEQTEELAIFDRAVEGIARAGRRKRFADWWSPSS